MVNITLAEDTIYLKKGFGEYTFYTSAEPYGGITCRGVTITWVSPTNGNLTICEAEGKMNFMLLVKLHNIILCTEDHKCVNIKEM